MQIETIPQFPTATLEILRVHVNRLMRKQLLGLHIEEDHPAMLGEEELIARSAEQLHERFAEGLDANPLFRVWKADLPGIVEGIARHDLPRLTRDPKEQSHVLRALKTVDLDSLWPQEWGC